MITQNEVFGTIETTLKALPGIDGRVWTGRINEPLPEDQWGNILPGVRMQLRVPSPVNDLPLSNDQLLDARIFRVQTTCFAATPEELMGMTDHVAIALTNLRIGAGNLRHSVEDEPVQPYLWDTTIEPNRPYAPLYWQIITQ